MELTVLGSGTLQPTTERGCSGYHVRIEKNNILLDAGSGVLRQLAKMGIEAEDLDYIFLSHLHIDHISDVIPILFSKKHVLRKIKKDLAIYGPRGFRNYYDSCDALFHDSIHPDGYNVEIIEYKEGKMDFEDFFIEFFPVSHTDNSHGIRITDRDGHILSYSGDTDYCENLVSICKNSDVAILECTFSDNNKVTGHLTPTEAGKAAAKAQCKQVILTHISAASDDAELIKCFSQQFKGKASVASELKTITF